MDRSLLLCALSALSVPALAGPQPTVFAHFYYWYPINANICTHHAPEGHFDRSDPAWWIGELRNAQYAGVDVLTLMYWHKHKYNPATLEVLLEAVRRMEAAGEPHPKVAMHLDGIESLTNLHGEWPIKHCDLTHPTVQEGALQAFVGFFRFFKERGMLDLCFRHDGKLVAFAYRPEYNNVQALADNSMVDLWHRRFREELGEDLYLVLETAYDYARQPATGTDMHCTNADNYYRWDAALHGPLLEKRGEFPIATVGPGFDPSGQGKDKPKRDRRDGETFREDLEQAIQWAAPWLVIETFNFFEEGTDITETQEFGRKYLDIARECTARFRDAVRATGPR